jgi:replicative DNA helicase
METRVPPNSLEAERGVLGAILLNSEALYSAVEILTPDDFYRTGHQVIFKHMTALDAGGKPVDTITLVESLRSTQELDYAGGGAYVATLTNEVPSSAHARYYAEQIKKLSFARTVIEGACTLRDSAYEEPAEAEAHVATFNAAAQIEEVKGQRENGQIILERMKHYERLYAKEAPPGIPTGFIDFDDNCPMRQKQTVILAGRPAMGKTAAALSFAIGIAKEGTPVAFVSLEMDADALMDRAISMVAEVDGRKMQDGNFYDSDFPKLSRATGVLNNLPLYIIDGVGWSSDKIRAVLSQYKTKYGIKVAFVDHLHEIKEPGNLDEFTNYSRAAANLRNAGKSLDLLMIVLAQLNREVEKRTPPIPIVADLKQTGKIEEVADKIIFIYRQDHYVDTQQVKTIRDELEGVGRFFVRKNRQGLTCFFDLTWLAPYTAFKTKEWRR